MNSNSKENLADLIADTLANYEDWDIVKDLKTSFIEMVQTTEPKVDLNLLSFVFEKFYSLSAVERHSPGFNHLKFVTNQIDLFFGK
jgi:hypothetical protein